MFRIRKVLDPISPRNRETAPETLLPFADARDNFYAAARYGMEAKVSWLGRERGDMRSLLVQRLLPLARRGLQRLEISDTDIDRYLGVIAERVLSGRTGAAWQRAWVQGHGSDMTGLTGAYVQRMESGRPVHEWGVD